MDYPVHPIDHRLLYLSRSDIESLGIELFELVDLLELVFREKALGRVSMPAKHWIERGSDRFFSAMTSYVPALGAAACKWQSGDPRNPRRGHAYIQGLLILLEDETGLPISVMDSTWITMVRTAAASVLTAKYLARTDAKAVGILGCGVQGRANLEGLKRLLPSVEQCLAYDILPEVATQFAAEMGRKLNIPVRSVDNQRGVVHNSDVIVTAGPIEKNPQPAIQAEWVKPGSLGIALDYDSYWTPSAINAFDRRVSDDIQQIHHLQTQGYFQQVHHVDAELGDIVAGRVQGRRSDTERILAFNLGVAIEDLVTALEIHRRAIARGVGTLLDL